MGRKRKQVEPSELANLPPCRVCDAPGAGFHYGVNTCEACKGFFHRSLRIHGQYKCAVEGDCIIEHGKGKLCQLCRYQKCLAVGMAKEAIKTGRYTSAKRTNDILEIKKLQRLKTGIPQVCEEENGTIQTSDISRNTTPENSCKTPTLFCSVQPESSEMEDLSEIGSVGQKGSDSYQISQGLLDYISQSGQHSGQDCDQSSMDCPGAEDSNTVDFFLDDSHQFHFGSMISARKAKSPQALQTQDVVFTSGESSQLSLNSLCETLAPMNPATTLQTALATTPEFLSSPSSFSYSIPSPAFLSPSTCNKEIPHQGACAAFSPFTSSSSSSSASRLPSPGAIALSPATSVFSSDSSSTNGALDSLMDCNMGSTDSESFTVLPCPNNSSKPSMPDSGLHLMEPDFPGSSCDPCDFDTNTKSLQELYMDKDAVVRALKEAHETYVTTVFGNLSDEEKERQQKEHFEQCRLRREMFGPLKKMPDHEYDFIFAMTGLDADDRQKHFRTASANMEKTIQGMVQFSQHIPGFSRVGIDDKVNLIKYSGHEFVGFTMFKYVNFDLKIMRGMDFEWKCEHDFMRCFAAQNQDMFETSLRFWYSLEKLKLTDEELCVVKAILVMSPDREVPVSSPVVREIHFHLTECLIYLVSKRCPEPLQKFAKIMDRLTESRTHTKDMTRTFKGLGIEKYSDFKERPLVKEMMAGILFDDKEETISDQHG